MATATPATRFTDYATCLLCHHVYCIIWLAECAKQAGNWFTFVAAYSVIQELRSADAATHTAVFLVCRRLPNLLLFPLSGLAADRLNRGSVLVAACLVQSCVSFTLPLVQARRQIELLYPLVFLQYCAQAFYDPARMASVPTVVPRGLLCVAGTLDTFGFSLMALIGAAVAGRTAAVYGAPLCFRVEGCTFLLAAALLLRLALQQRKLRSMPTPMRATRRPKGPPAHPVHVDDMALLEEGLPPELQPLLGDEARCGQHPHSHPHPDPAPASAPAAAAPHEHHPQTKDGRDALYEGSEAARSGGSCGGDGGDGGGDESGRETCGGCGCLGALAYMARRANWDVAALVWVKATGAICWGAADVLNGRFSQIPQMQTLGGADQTLGFILVTVGLGSIAGPLVANSVTPGAARFWRVSIAVAFGMLAAGYSLMATARNIYFVLLSTVIRTSGSNTLYIHSLTILQHRLPDSVRGRVFAVEFVLYTLSEAGSTLFGGAAEDALGWGTRRLSAAMATLAGAFMVVWGLHAWLMWGSRADPAAGVDAHARPRGDVDEGGEEPRAAAGGRPSRI